MIIHRKYKYKTMRIIEEYVGKSIICSNEQQCLLIYFCNRTKPCPSHDCILDSSER